MKLPIILELARGGSLSWVGPRSNWEMWNRSKDKNKSEPATLPGVIDTIGIAFSRLVSRPYVVLGPVLLDLYLWLGLRITAGPLVLKVANLVEPIESVGESLASSLEGQQRYNITELLSLQLLSVRMPTFLPLLVSDESVRLNRWNPELADAQWWLVLLIGMFFIVTGFLAGTAFLLWLADVSRQRTHHFKARETARVSLYLVLWLSVSAGLLLLFSWPLLVAQAGLIYFGAGFNGFLAFLMVIPLGVGFVLFFFSVYSIVLERATSVESFRASYRVVRAFGWQSLGYIVSYLIVTGGLPFFWRMLIDEPPGTMLAIIGNAFVSTGMIAAGMIYYEDRVAALATQNGAV